MPDDTRSSPIPSQATGTRDTGRLTVIPTTSTDDEGNESSESVLARRVGELATNDHIWEAPHMRHIEQAAKALKVKREGLAALVFNRAALLAGPSVVGQIDSRGTFHLASVNALVGRSGAGSNVSKRGAERLLPVSGMEDPPPRSFSAPELAEMHDWGMVSISPATGSALVALMQYRARIGERENDYVGFVPRVELTYTEGSILLSSLRKSNSSSSQASSLEPLILDAFVGDSLRADIADRGSRVSIPAGSYTLGVQAYFQAEIVGEALAKTTGLAQRLRLVPITQPRGDGRLIDAGRILAYGGEISDEDIRALLDSREERPAFPGELAGVVEFLTSIPCVAEQRDQRVMSMPPRMAMDLELMSESLSSGLAEDDPLITHVVLNMYRTAAQSALLRQSYAISMEDWAIAREFSRLSHATRELALEWAKEAERAEETKENARHARRTRVTENARSMAKGETPPLIRMLGKRYRERVLTLGEVSGTELRNCLSPTNVREWGDSEGLGGKTGLHKTVLAYCEASGMLGKNGRRYTVKSK